VTIKYKCKCGRKAECETWSKVRMCPTCFTKQWKKDHPPTRKGAK